MNYLTIGSLALLVLSLVALVGARLTAKNDGKTQAPTGLLNVAVGVSLANLVLVGVLFYLKDRRGDVGKIGEIANLVVHLGALGLIVAVYIMNRQDISSLSRNMVIASGVLFVLSIPFTLYHLMKGGALLSGIGGGQSKVQDRDLVKETLQPDINQETPCNYDAQKLLQQFQKVSNTAPQPATRQNPPKPASLFAQPAKPQL